MFSGFCLEFLSILKPLTSLTCSEMPCFACFCAHAVHAVTRAIQALPPVFVLAVYWDNRLHLGSTEARYTLNCCCCSTEAFICNFMAKGELPLFHLPMLSLKPGVFPPGIQFNIPSAS
jgi:hypothetical protein